MSKTVELRQQRAALIEQNRALLDKAEAAKRDLTAEETQEFARRMTEVDQLLARIEREERQFALEAALTQTTGRPPTGPPFPTGPVAPAAGDGHAEYRSAFWGAFRRGFQVLSDTEVRSLSVGVNVAGGFLVPDDFERRLVELLTAQNVMRAAATVVTTSHDRQIPVETGKGTAHWAAEGTIAPESDPAFGQRLLTAHKISTLILISTELLQDSAFDIEGYVSRLFAHRIGEREEAAFVAGTGVNQPRGIILDAPTGVTAAAAAAITADELIRLFHAVPVPYRARGSWLLNDATILAVRLLKETSGQYIWQPGLQAGQPDRLLGRPVLASAAMPTMAAGARSVIFGDLTSYWIGDRKGRTMQRLTEAYATSGQVGFLGTQRVDGLLIQPDAVRRLVHP